MLSRVFAPAGSALPQNAGTELNLFTLPRPINPATMPGLAARRIGRRMESIELISFMPELSQKHFADISQMMYHLTGINLQHGKEELVKARLVKRLRILGIENFDEYLELVKRQTGAQELSAMIDALTTNKTNFFREAQHFDFLRSRVFPVLRPGSRKMRYWCAGCSSGEEAYSLAILLREEIADVDLRDCRILATDISTRVLAKAREAVYEEEQVRDVPPVLLNRHFTCIRTTPNTLYRVNDRVRGMVRFARLNLVDPWPLSGPFDAIFCRNVMIYFDKPTQKEVALRFRDLLKVGGFLFIGHSESLTGLTEFRYIQPAVYQKLSGDAGKVVR